MSRKSPDERAYQEASLIHPGPTVIQGQEREPRSPCHWPSLTKLPIKKDLTAPVDTSSWRPGGEPRMFHAARLPESTEKAGTWDLWTKISLEEEPVDHSKARKTQLILPKKKTVPITLGKSLSQAERGPSHNKCS